MNGIEEINFTDIQKELKYRKNIVYGAGFNGQFLFKELTNKEIIVEAFYDDDKSRWGELFCGKRILSLSDLLQSKNDDTNICL